MSKKIGSSLSGKILGSILLCFGCFLKASLDVRGRFPKEAALNSFSVWIEDQMNKRGTLNLALLLKCKKNVGGVTENLRHFLERVDISNLYPKILRCRNIGYTASRTCACAVKLFVLPLETGTCF